MMRTDHPGDDQRNPDGTVLINSTRLPPPTVSWAMVCRITFRPRYMDFRSAWPAGANKPDPRKISKFTSMPPAPKLSEILGQLESHIASEDGVGQSTSKASIEATLAGLKLTPEEEGRGSRARLFLGCAT